METIDDDVEKFQEKLTALESGKPLEASLEGLSSGEADLLKLALTLREFHPPARKTNVVMAQLARITRTTEEQHAAGQMHNPSPSKRSFPSRPSWFLPLAVAGSAAIFFINCLVMLGVVIGASRLVVGYFNRLNQLQASVSEMRGLVERREQDGSWTKISPKAIIMPGTHLRTAELSSALLSLEGGNQLRMGPGTEIMLDQMDKSLRGVLITRIIQWQGKTDHQIRSSKHPSSLYEVRIPGGTLTAHGTDFTVEVDANQQTRVVVTQGTVNVSGGGSTVSVPAGKITTLTATTAPTTPAFLAQGEGVFKVIEEAISIAGQPVLFEPAFQLTNMPHDGDMVTFQGQRRPDGTVQVDRLETLVTRQQANSFRLTGSVEAFADTALVAADMVIQTNANTQFLDTIPTGKGVTIEGFVQTDGMPTAARVYESGSGQPLQFTGIVESIDTDAGIWIITGIAISISRNTSIAQGIALGDMVEVQGWFQDGDWLAGSIRPATHNDHYFDITGTVKNIDPWIINDIRLEVRTWTRIDSTIKNGDQVRIRGTILADGSWVATTIEKVQEIPDEQVTLEFIGTINSTEPWVISGISLVVDATTQIEGMLVTGTLVKVHATRLTDGNWHADSIVEIVPPGIGCVTYASIVIIKEGQLITLQDGSTIDLNEVERVEGDVEVDNVILVVKCVAADGKITYPLVKVLEDANGTPTPSFTNTPTATSTSLPASIILPNCYKITFLGTQDNGDGTSTWRYEVEELSCAKDLSNWVLELPDCSQIVNASPSPWEAVHPDPNHHLNGIKWQTGAGFERGVFTVVLSGDLTTGIPRVGAKGPDVAIGYIAGPICNLGTMTPSPTPTITLSPTITLTPTSTVKSSPTRTPKPTNPPPTQPPPPAISGPVVITENNQILTINCSGASVTVNGNNNTLALYGMCSSLIVRGNNNRITVPAGTPINNTGNGNVINQQ